jgi:hypothetical protein
VGVTVGLDGLVVGVTVGLDGLLDGTTEGFACGDNVGSKVDSLVGSNVGA